MLFTPDVCLEDLSLQRYSVLPLEPLHDLKGYLGGILRKLPSVIPNGPLKDGVAAYLDSLWKKEHLYVSGSAKRAHFDRLHKLRYASKHVLV